MAQETKISYDDLRKHLEENPGDTPKAHQRTLSQLTVGELVGLPPNMANRIQGEDLASMREDALGLKEALDALTSEAMKSVQQQVSPTDRLLAQRRYAVPEQMGSS